MFDQPGVYEITLEVTNNNGTDETFDVVEVLQNPFADFDFEIDGLQVNFEDNSIGGPDMIYIWEFGDGFNSNEQEPIHFYDNPGNYTVLLDIENDCGFDILEQDIELYDTPEAMFSVDSQVGCGGDEFQFSDISYGNIVSRTWSFPGGTPSTSTAPNPIVSYPTPGNYDVTLEVLNPDGASTETCLLYTSPSPRDQRGSRMPSSA